MIGYAGVIFFLIIIFIGIFLLQVYLSKSVNAWFGLILPISSLAVSLLTIMGMAGYNAHLRAGTTDVSREGAAAIVHAMAPIMNSVPSLITPIILIFLMMNIPTLIFVAIYATFRVRQNRRRNIGNIEFHDI